jgi:hypothetical protein
MLGLVEELSGSSVISVIKIKSTTVLDDLPRWWPMEAQRIVIVTDEMKVEE